jgi:hypothetical protein
MEEYNLQEIRIEDYNSIRILSDEKAGDGRQQYT